MNKLFKYLIAIVLSVMVYGLVYVILLIGGGYIDSGPPRWVEVLAVIIALATFIVIVSRITKSSK